MTQALEDYVTWAKQPIIPIILTTVFRFCLRSTEEDKFLAILRNFLGTQDFASIRGKIIELIADLLSSSFKIANFILCADNL